MNANSSLADVPTTEPEIEILRLDEPPFAVNSRELQWGFIVPEVGESARRYCYDHPSRSMTSFEELTVTVKTRIHEREGYEIRTRDYSSSGDLRRESYAYGILQGGMAHWLAWWNMSDEAKIITWKDEGFEWDWGATPTRIVDAGRYHWQDDRRLELNREVQSLPKVNRNGAGLWLLKIGGREHRCLRVMEVDDPARAGTSLLEAFVNEEGRTLMTRRYAAPQYPIHSAYCGIPLYSWEGTRTAEDLLKDSSKLIINGATFYLWYDYLAEMALLGNWGVGELGN
jgi:hypothetical protein